MTQSVALRYQCPRCQAQNQQSDVASASRLACTACDWSREITEDEFHGETPARCLACGTQDLWRQKDFPQILGIIFVGMGAIGSSIAWYYHRPVVALGVLLAVAAIDFGLFAVMPDVLVCYRCRARHSGGEISEHPTFDHETAERYRQEKLRQEDVEATNRSEAT